MSNYSILYPEEAITVKINWSDPKPILDFNDSMIKNSELGYFYKFIGIYGSYHRLFYIGKTYSRYVSKRIKDADHKAKQNEYHKEHTKHKLYVSVGVIESKKRIDLKLISDIEQLLIYSHSNDDFKFLKNKKSIYNHHVIKNYNIINAGFRDDGMLKEIYYGLFYK